MERLLDFAAKAGRIYGIGLYNGQGSKYSYIVPLRLVLDFNARNSPKIPITPKLHPEGLPALQVH
jgi:hypothetical protein